MTSPGIFITFEGSEGCSNTTHLARLARQLEAERADREVLVAIDASPPVDEIERLIWHHLTARFHGFCSPRRL